MFSSPLRTVKIESFKANKNNKHQLNTIHYDSITDFNTQKLFPEVEREQAHGENETTQLVAISSKYMG